jgi:hypothetical protein
MNLRQICAYVAVLAFFKGNEENHEKWICLRIFSKYKYVDFCAKLLFCKRQTDTVLHVTDVCTWGVKWTL